MQRSPLYDNPDLTGSHEDEVGLLSALMFDTIADKQHSSHGQRLEY